jgi:hypothetical protein
MLISLVCTMIWSIGHWSVLVWLCVDVYLCTDEILIPNQLSSKAFYAIEKLSSKNSRHTCRPSRSAFSPLRCAHWYIVICNGSTTLRYLWWWLNVLSFSVPFFSVGNMLQTRRAGDDDLTESSQKNRRIDNSRGETLDLIIAGPSTIHFSVHVSLQLFCCNNSRVPSCFF